VSLIAIDDGEAREKGGSWDGSREGIEEKKSRREK